MDDSIVRFISEDIKQKYNINISYDAINSKVQRTVLYLERQNITYDTNEFINLVEQALIKSIISNDSLTKTKEQFTPKSKNVSRKKRNPDPVMGIIDTSERTYKWFDKYPTLRLAKIDDLPPQVQRKNIVHLGSLYRNIRNYPNPNEYSFKITNTTNSQLNKGNRVFQPGIIPSLSSGDVRNIIAFKLLSYTLPDITSSSPIISDEPFLYLQIQEFEGKVHTPVGKMFAILPYDLNKNISASFLTKEKSIPYPYEWAVDRPKEYINRLSLKLCGSDGESYNFIQDNYQLLPVIPADTSGVYTPGDNYSVKTITFSIVDGILPTGGRKITMFDLAVSNRYETSPGVFIDTPMSVDNDLNQKPFDANFISTTKFSISFKENPYVNQHVPNNPGVTGIYRGISITNGGYIILNSAQNSFVFEITKLGDT